MSQLVNEEGTPLRSDGSPFPEDPSQWSEEEREYLSTYAFGRAEEFDQVEETVASVDVPEGSGEAIA